ncbi:MAG: translocation/assembly module TamB domain-containing protein [Bacteriovoracaceae bacterium]
MRFKGILGSFFFLFIVSIAGMTYYVQSASFGRVLSKVLSDIIYKKTSTEIVLERVDLNLFPPGIEIKKIDIYKKISDVEVIESQIGSLGFYINFYELEENKISLGEVKIEDTYIKYLFPKKPDEPMPEELEQKLIDQIFDFSQIGPLRVDTIVLQNVYGEFNQNSLDIKRLKIIRYPKTFRIKSYLANIAIEDSAPFRIDGIWADIDIGRKDINIHNLRVHQDTHEAKINGLIKSYPKLKHASAELNGDIKIDLPGIKRFTKLPEMISFQDGTANTQFKISYDGQIKGDYVVDLENLRSSFLSLDQLSAKGDITAENVLVNSLELNYKDESLKTTKPFSLVQIDGMKFFPGRVTAEIKNFSLGNAISILGPSLQVLQGQLTGQLGFELKQSNLYFYPRDGFYIKDLALVVPTKEGEDFSIIHAKETRLSKADFQVIDNEFRMKANIKMPQTDLRLEGKVNKDRVSFKTFGGKIRLEDLGDIAQIGVKGNGPLALEVNGPLDDVEINLKGLINDFQVLGYKLGDADQETLISLKDSTVNIIQLSSKYNKTEIYGNGYVNYDNLELNLDIRSPQTTHDDLKSIIAPVLSPITFLPSDLNFKAKLDCKIYGKANLQDLKVKTKVNFRDLEAYKESISHGFFSIMMEDKILKFKDVKAFKERGALLGEVDFNMNTEIFNLDLDWNNIGLQSINKVRQSSLSFDAILDGSLKGGGTSKDYTIKINSNIGQTKAFNYDFKDSLIELTLSPERYRGKLFLFEDEIKANFDINMKQTSLSNFDLAVDLPNLKPVLAGVLGGHIELEDIKASTAFQYKASFYPDLSIVNFSGFLKKISLSHSDFNFSYKSNKPQFIVNNNKIERWDFEHTQNDIQLKSSGRGTFGDKVIITHESVINSNILEILFSQVLAADGILSQSFVIEGYKNNYAFNILANSKGLDLSIDNLPVPLNNTDYSLEFSDRKLLVKNFRTQFQTGSVSATGDIYFDNDDPDINLSFKVDRAEIPILGKSSINLSGEGIILGNNLPYNLSGEIKLNKALFVNELSEFESKSSVSQIRYLPKDQESVVGKLLTLNLIVETEQPVRITNSLMDVSLRGELSLSGNAGRPRADGRLFSPQNVSRVFFKNSEYTIAQADINFSAKKDIANPDFDVQATTLISSYKITAKAAGDLERFSFDLTSDPALTQNSILSLIAFGYTDEIQNTLTQGDQQSLTSMGVGSFVFDRFRINDILKKQFGLQVNLGTVLEQSQNSMISGRGGDSSGPTDIARTRSATKIEVKKRLDEALSLSVSSTMGGSIGQRQSMNLNYSINKTLQLEGVYELKTNAEGEEDIIDTSVGGDVKLRWTFK